MELKTSEFRLKISSLVDTNIVTLDCMQNQVSIKAFELNDALREAADYLNR